MKKMFLLYLLMGVAYANAQVTDNFADKDLNTNPTWKGDLSKFTTENKRLRSNSNLVNDAFYLSTKAVSAIESQWELKVELLFSTSSKNLLQFVLMSDSQNLFNAQNGYFLEIGGTKDKITFYRILEGVNTELFSTADGTISGGNSRTNVKVLREKDSVFKVYVDYNGGVDYTLEGTFKDGTIASSMYSGIKIEQSTASFFTKHYMDDFYVGPIVLDTKPPVVTQLFQLDLQTLEINFNEDLDSSSVLYKSIFFVDKSIGNPSKVEFKNGQNKRTLLLNFSELGNPEKYTLTIKQIKDKALNTLDTSITFTSIIPKGAKVNKLLITELFPVTEPSVTLPNGEFIELFNKGQDPIDLGKYSIADKSGSKKLLKQILLKGEYIILCSEDDSAAFKSYGKVMALQSLPSLNNDGDRIQVLDEGNKVIHEVIYTSSIFPEEKKNGWTLEMIDTDNPCHFYGNWAASIDKSGGTPGRENSVKGKREDKARPMVQSIYPVSSNAMEIYFSENVELNSALDASNYYLMTHNEFSDTVIRTDSLNKFLVHFELDLGQGITHALEIRNTEDCVGNSLDRDTIYFGLAQEIEKGDLVINELLYEPAIGGEEYVELFNSSSKFLDLKNLKLAVKEDGAFTKVEFVSSLGYLLAPKSFLVICKDKNKVIPFYNTIDSMSFYEMSALPSLTSAGLELVLLNVQNEAIDAVAYSPKWHYEVVDDTKGVSLEKIKIGIANNKSNWTSASKASGFGTPGIKNSQSIETSTNTDEISLEYQSFSPNQDGLRDVLLINYKMDKSNATANVFIFNSNGALITKIANNETLSSSGSIAWKGETESGVQSQTGIYIILFEYFFPDGTVKRKKMSCSLVLE